MYVCMCVLYACVSMYMYVYLYVYTALLARYRNSKKIIEILNHSM